MLSKAATVGIPNSFEIGCRALGDTTSPITADESKIQSGDIILSRARTLSMHAIITLGQIYKYRWDSDNSFRFWSHPAMIVAVAEQQITNRAATKQATIKRTALVQATVNPKGVNYAFLDDFRKDYSSRCWIFSPQKFNDTNRREAVEEAEREAGLGLYEWLAENGALGEEIPVSGIKTHQLNGPRPQRHFTYGMLSLLCILTSQLFPKWLFRFFNEGQVTCSGFIAELMEKADYAFDSEIHVFPAEVAELLYLELQSFQMEGVDTWTEGAARLRAQMSADRKVMFKNATSFRLSAAALTTLIFMLGILGALVFVALPFLFQGFPWPVRWVLYVIGTYLSIVAAPMLHYALRFTYQVAFSGIPRLIR
ncbi:MAG: hypothetical protein ABIP64_13025, partial [Burkholderiales bacterium]